MRKTRRTFIKKMALGSLFGTLGLPQTFGKEVLDSFDKSDRDVWQEVKSSFMLDPKRSYFNTAGVGPSPKPVVDAIYEAMQNVNYYGETFHHKISTIREQVANFFNVDENEIAFTRNSTEGINIMAQCLPLKKGDEVILTTHEHVGGATPWLKLQKEIGIKLKVIDLDLSGEHNFKIIKQAISRKTKAIMISHVTCTTGMVLPVKEIAALCKQKQLFCCIDGAQSAGMLHIDLKDIDPDIYVTSGHKWLFGPKETGLVYINQRTVKSLKPAFVGAYSVKSFNLKKQEIDFVANATLVEYGTRSMPMATGLGTAIAFLEKIGMAQVENRGKLLANYLKSELIKIEGVELLSPKNPEFASAIVTFRIKNVDYLKIQHVLIKKHHCRVRAIYENELNGIRISCAIYNSYEELDHLIEAIKKIA